MGAACGKGHNVNQDNEPYEPKVDASPKKRPSESSKKSPKKGISTNDPVILNGEHEEDVDEEEVKIELAQEVKTEARPGGGGGGKVQFPEQQNIQKYIDPEKSTAVYHNALESATLVAQKGEFYSPSVFHLTFGLCCCTCNLPINDSCTVILGFTYHNNSSCLSCHMCNTPLAGAKKVKASDITVLNDGKLVCDSCSVKDLPVVCAASKAEVKEEDVDLTVIACGRYYLHNYVKCTSCERPLTNVKLCYNGELFCPSCYSDKLAPSCHQTNKKIIGRSLQIENTFYQIDSLKCPKCSFKICAGEGVYLMEGSPPIHMDCSKSISSTFYKVVTDDEGLFSAFETDMGSDSDRGFSEKKTGSARTDVSYSSINTSFSSLPFSRSEKAPELSIPEMYRIKNSNQYMGSYLKPDRDSKPKGLELNGTINGPVANGSLKINIQPSSRKDKIPPVENGTHLKYKTTRTQPKRIDSADYSGPLAPMYYKKERERRKQEKARQARLEMIKQSSQAGGQANGHTDASESEAETTTMSINRTGDTTRAYEGDVSMMRMDSTADSEIDSPRVSRVRPTGFNGSLMSPSSDTENESTTIQHGTFSSDTEAETPGDFADGDVPRPGKAANGINGHDKEADLRGYVTEDEIENMKSGLGKEILREMRMHHETGNKEEMELLQVPDDPIKASRSPDAKTEVQLPYFCEIKFGPIATGINRYCDVWLLEQASKEPMTTQDYSNFMQGFRKFAQASEPWKTSTTDNSMVDGAMSDTEGFRRFGTSSRLMSGYRSDGYKTDGYSSSPEMGRRKMVRYNSLDVRKAWYHERFLTFVQMYHRRGNLLFEQQREACFQHIRRSAASLSRNADLKVYPKEKLYTNVNKKLPQDVHRSHLELHLSDQDFVDLFAMTQDQFRSLPPWKQNVLKQLNYLF